MLPAANKSISDEAAESMRPVGALIVGHGTRDQCGTAEFRELVRNVADRMSPLPVEAGFLELAEPTIAAGFQRLVDRGVRSVVVAPILLFAAGHARRDVPEACVEAAVAAGLKADDVRQAAHLGLDERIVELSVQRFREAAEAGDRERRETASVGPIGLDETFHLFVGRGTTDPAALEEFHEFARLRRSAGPCSGQGSAFAALAEPTLATGLATARASACRRVIVQPHLLFGGSLLEQVQAATASASRDDPTKQWLVTRQLGVDPLLVDLVAHRITTTLETRPTPAVGKQDNVPQR